MQRDVGIYLPLFVGREEMVRILKCIDGVDFEVSAEDWKGQGYCVYFAGAIVASSGYVYVIYSPPGEHGISAEEEYGSDQDVEFLEAADTYHYYGLNYTNSDLAKLVIKQVCEVAAKHLDKGWIRNGSGQICRLSDVFQKAKRESEWNFADYEVRILI